MIPCSSLFCKCDASSHVWSASWLIMPCQERQRKSTMTAGYLRLLHFTYFKTSSHFCSNCLYRKSYFLTCYLQTHMLSHCSGAFSCIHHAGDNIIRQQTFMVTNAARYHCTEEIIIMVMCFCCMSPKRVINYTAVSIRNLTCTSHPLNWVSHTSHLLSVFYYTQP